MRSTHALMPQPARPSTRGDGLKFAAFIASVILLIILILYVAVIVGSVLYLPAVFGLGAWLFHRGLIGLRDALFIANTPTAKVASAAMGLVELSGMAIAEHPTAAAVSGRPSVWWDVDVHAWHRDRRGKSRWYQVLAQHGGNGRLALEDETGRVPVWLRGAELLLETHTWESDKGMLPAHGIGLLHRAGFAWDGGRRLRVRERRMEAGGPLYVLGTLDEVRRLSLPGDERGMARLLHGIRSGEWRDAVVGAAPEVMRGPLLVAISYFGMFLSLNPGGHREQRLQNVPLPELPPDAVLVWKGRQGRGFIVANRRESAALAALRKRSLGTTGAGVVVLCFALYQVLQLF